MQFVVLKGREEEEQGSEYETALARARGGGRPSKTRGGGAASPFPAKGVSDRPEAGEEGKPRTLLRRVRGQQDQNSPNEDRCPCKYSTAPPVRPFSQQTQPTARSTPAVCHSRYFETHLRPSAASSNCCLYCRYCVSLDHPALFPVCTPPLARRWC